LHDRTTQVLLNEKYLPHTGCPQEQALINAGVYRYFGTVATSREVGWLEAWDQRRVLAAVQAVRSRGESVFTGAYVITNGGRSEPKEAVVCDYLTKLWAKRGDIVEAIQTNSWYAAASAMRVLPGFGGTGFMSKEVLLDTMLVPGCWAKDGPRDKNTWCPIGPGARRGVVRVLNRSVGSYVTEALALHTVRALFDARHLMWDGIELELHDIQFQLCEFDKMERVRLGQGKPKARYQPRNEHASQ
jgi:hypothetical protein